MGPDHSAFGRARHPFMTGSAGWSYFAATRYILGIRPDFDALIIDPCIPPAWKGFKARRIWRDAIYEIEVENPGGPGKGVRECTLNGVPLDTPPSAGIPVKEPGSVNYVRVLMECS
jgi:N,N'-diacetylchitobiose phosphorylase